MDQPKIVIDRPTIPELPAKRSVNKAGRSVFNFAAGIVFLTLLGAVGFGAYWQLKRTSYLISDDSVFVELKVIDPSGSPLAGAKVFEMDQLVGSTDSFGEWSKFARYPLGATLGFRVVTRIDGKLLEATKNFAMPLETKEQTHFQTVLQLKDPSEDKATLSLSDDSNKSATAAAPVPNESHEEVEAPTAPSEHQPTEVTAVKESSPEATAPPIPARGGLTIDTSKAIRAADEKVIDELKTKVMPKLSDMLRAQGNDKKDFRMQLVPAQGSDALVVIREFDATGKVQGAVLRNVAKTAAQTFAVLKPAIQWLASNSSEPAKSEWKRQQVNILGKIEPRDEVFVGGYLARSLNDKGQYQYYGENFKAMNVTVIRDQELIGRGRIVNRTWGNPAVFSLPSGNVAIR